MSHSVPPQAPNSQWLLGSLPALRKNPLRFFQELADLGGVVRFRLLGVRCYLVSDPEGVGRILTSGSDSYSKYTPDTLLFRNLLGPSLLTTEGQLHRAQRRM